MVVIIILIIIIILNLKETSGVYLTSKLLEMKI